MKLMDVITRRLVFGISVLLAAITLTASERALAGPPFMTDDPEPVDYGHWEVYGFSAGAHGSSDTSGLGPSVEVNYGARPNLQLHLIMGFAFDEPAGRPLRMGMSDIELGAKYRFIDPGPDDWWPQVGVFPSLSCLPAMRRAGWVLELGRNSFRYGSRRISEDGPRTAAAVIGLTPAPATETSGSPAGCCNAKSPIASLWVARFFIRHPPWSAARPHRGSTWVASMILQSITICCSRPGEAAWFMP